MQIHFINASITAALIGLLTTFFVGSSEQKTTTKEMMMNTTPIVAETHDEPIDSTTFRGTFTNDEYQVWITIDFYGSTVTVPDQELFGQLPGYLGAKRDPRKWFITDATITSPKTAHLEIINDYGSEDLEATLTQLNDSTYQLHQDNGSPLRIVAKSKWVKLPKTLVLVRSKR